jgi:hypothetical protein
VAVTLLAHVAERHRQALVIGIFNRLRLPRRGPQQIHAMSGPVIAKLPASTEDQFRSHALAVIKKLDVERSRTETEGAGVSENPVFE